jgi:hypothetical protein
MAYAIQQGIQISLDGSTWYQLTDHNRSAISIKIDHIEKASRMANGIMRKYIVAKKSTISTSWNMIPSQTTSTVDGGYSSAWIEAFYQANAGIPIYVKVVGATEDIPTLGLTPAESYKTSLNSSKTYYAFINSFNKTIVGRTANGDMVHIDMEFQEI